MHSFTICLSYVHTYIDNKLLFYWHYTFISFISKRLRLFMTTLMNNNNNNWIYSFNQMICFTSIISAVSQTNIYRRSVRRIDIKIFHICHLYFISFFLFFCLFLHFSSHVRDWSFILFGSVGFCKNCSFFSVFSRVAQAKY